VQRISWDRNQQLTSWWSTRKKTKTWSVDRILQDRNQQLKSTTYPLSRHQRKKIGDQWTECHRTWINNLQPVKASEKENRWSVDRMSQDRNQQLTACQSIRERKQVISGQNVTGHESTTY
jgi:hypothetical protein